MVIRTEFFVPGKAAPQGSKRHVGRGILIESSKELGPWRERVALAAHAVTTQMAEKSRPVGVDILFIMPRPTSTPKTKTPPAVKRPDLDKLTRAILDALTGISYEDDSQVTYMSLKKRLSQVGEQPGAEIEVFWSEN